ncbi:hypothetical protein J6590_066804 [Homalodisca vitripennis]|nr:hypothetical protein J6590_066804 [Homalodisca vitripennis]
MSRGCSVCRVEISRNACFAFRTHIVYLKSETSLSLFDMSLVTSACPLAQRSYAPFQWY